MSTVTGFMEANLNPDNEEHPRLTRMWKVRDSLMRPKNTEKVINFKYEHDQTPPLGTLIAEDSPPPNPFDCEDDECEVCFPQFFPATTKINDSIAQQTMSTLKETIEENLAFLRDALTAHADFVVTRWRKKSRDKRFAFLEAHSALYPKKWASIHLLNACPIERHGNLVRDDLLYQVRIFPKIKPPFADTEISDKLGEFLARACTQHPWPRGRKSQEWLLEAEASQEALDVFWSEMRTIWTRKLRREGRVAERYIKEDIDGLMRFSQEERHLKELAARREYILRQLERSKKQTLDIDATPQTVWGEDTSSSSSFTPIARKTRTRSPPDLGQDSGSHSRLIEPTATPIPQPELIKIAVRRDNIAIFKAMFPEKGEDSSRSFAWQHFLAAITDAGFSILQSQGSAVTLKLDRSKGEDKIVVHRPHPVATLHPIMLRAIAKRITKWFGWHRETIVEREE